MVILIFGISLLVQGQHEPSPKAVRLFDKSLLYFRAGELTECEEQLRKTIQADSTYADAWILWGDLKREQRDLEASITGYRKALLYHSSYPQVVMQLLANALYDAEKYGEAAAYYREILSASDLREELRRSLEEKNTIARFRQDLMDHPVPYQPINLGPGINTASEEYANVVGAESDQLIFTRRSPISDDPMQREFQEDFYRSLFRDGEWRDAEPFSFLPDSKGDAGGLCISADGRWLFFTACFRKDSQGSCDLYYSEKTGEGWSIPRNMGNLVNSDNWDAQPSISPDGQTLYFASNREGSIGSSDIWMTQKLPNGSWSDPVNLGVPVNSKGSEMAPFIHFDNRSLYFSSIGHPGMGGHDLFQSRRTNSGWSVPKNLGYPVNTRSDELVMVVAPDGSQAYISAELPQGHGGYDIYSFLLPQELQAVAVTYMKGRVFDLETLEPLRADFELIDLKADSMVTQSSSAADGSFLVCLPTGNSYALNVSSPGYLFYSDFIELAGISSQADPYLKDVPMEPVKVGKFVVLKNIFFETDQYRLEPVSFTELNKLAAFLEENPGISIEISGHTDNVGTEAYNQVLSENRSRSVMDYLVGKGVDPGRLHAAGYGFSRPLADNETEEGRAENRRTEIRVTGIR